MLESVLKHLADDEPNAIARLKQLLAIPSVSTDPAYAQDVEHCARWITQFLAELGFEAAAVATDGHPAVLAHCHDQDILVPDAPHVLFYGHYDVQPPHPIDAWTTPPFEPTVRDGAIYARGASDDKGQVCTFLESLRAWKRVHGKWPVRVTVLIEGEEETGSINLPGLIDKHRDALSADLVLISDTSMWDRQTIAITYGLRGMLYFDIRLHGPTRDLHSGIYGGAVANPATVLAQVLGRLFDDEHRINIPTFYDRVQSVDKREGHAWSRLNFDEREYLDPIGVSVPFGESGYTTLERRWARPSCDINGLFGGYDGVGAKTIIPGFAGAKVSFRLVPNQNAGEIADQFRQWLDSQPVHGCQWQIEQLGSADPAVTPTDSPYMTAAQTAVERCSGRAAALVREGGTIPVVSELKKKLGLDSLLLGFGLPDDHVHAPDEKLDLSCFQLGCQTHATLLAEFAGLNRDV